MTEILEKTKKNIFPLSRPAIVDFAAFNWHKGANGQIDSFVNHSSQALMLDIFGLIDCSKNKDKIINSAFKIDGHDWVVSFEYEDASLLCEPKSTQVDVLLQCDIFNVLVECKFTEKDGGACSQTKKLDSGIVQCNGKYQTQINPRFNSVSRCSLTGKNIKYWDVIEKIYRFSSGEEYDPCPFRNGNYQWMRNLCFAHAMEQRTGKPSKFFICYFDSSKFEISRKIKKGLLQDIRKELKDSSRVDEISYNKILEIGIASTEESESCEWKQLRDWVGQKVENCV